MRSLDDERDIAFNITSRDVLPRHGREVVPGLGVESETANLAARVDAVHGLNLAPRTAPLGVQTLNHAVLHRLVHVVKRAQRERRRRAAAGRVDRGGVRRE